MMTNTAAETLVKQYEGLCYGLVNAAAARNRHIHDTDKDDLMQVARLAVLRAAEHYNAERGAAFGTYAHRAVANALIDACQAIRPHVSLEAAREDGLDNDPAVMDMELEAAQNDDGLAGKRVALRLAVEALEGEDRAVARLLLEGRNLREIAEALGLRGANVRGMAHHRVERVTKQLGQLLGA
jgi:RNA polymerase sigma factor (sigma-70 family)